MSFLNGSIHRLHPQTERGTAALVGPFGGCEYAASSRVGSDLTSTDHDALESRWINPETALRAGLRRVDSLTGAEIVGRRGGGDYSGICIPYFHPGSNQVRDYRLRRDHPDLEYDAAGELKAKRKYLSPPGRSNMLYLPPGVSQSLLGDPMLPVVITEGEFKTLALWRGPPSGFESASVSAVGRIWCLQLAGNNWQNDRSRRQSDGHQGSDSGSRLGRLGWAPGCDRL